MKKGESLSSGQEVINHPQTPEMKKNAINKAFDSHLENLSRFQGESEKLKSHEDAFKEEIINNKEITKEDLTDWIVLNAFTWSQNASTAHDGWCRDAD